MAADTLRAFEELRKERRRQFLWLLGLSIASLIASIVYLVRAWA